MQEHVIVGITAIKKIKKNLILIVLCLLSLVAIATLSLYFYEDHKFKSELISEKYISDGIFVSTEKVQTVAKKTELEILCQIEWFNSAAATVAQKKFTLKKKLQDCFENDFFKSYKDELTQKLTALSEGNEVSVFDMTVKPEINAVIASASEFANKLGHVQGKLMNPEYIGPPVPPEKNLPKPERKKKQKTK